MTEYHTRLKIVAETAKLLLDYEHFSWERKYNAMLGILFPAASEAFRAITGDRIDYYDPDTTYQEDTEAAGRAIMEAYTSVEYEVESKDAVKLLSNINLISSWE